MRRPGRVAILCLLLGPFAGTIAQDAALVATVDRNEIRANESFTYVLTAEGSIAGGRPDLSAVMRDFDVLQSRSSTSIQIVNGEATQVAEWILELMPRGPGTFELPPVELGGTLSNTLVVEILPPESGNDANADVFMEVELDRSEVYVQAQAIFTLRLFVGIPTGREALLPLPVEGGEAIVESLGSDREYQIVRGDRNYRVRERKFAIFPQSPGVLAIGPVEYQATVIPGVGFSRRQSLQSDTIELTVLPAVAPPASNPDAVWLPAQDVTIEEDWSTASNRFEQGVPRTRELTVVAKGLLETQLPAIELIETDGLRQYADQPDLAREVAGDGITARRTERFAVIANRPGTIEFPPVELPWWNVDTGRWEIARVDSTTIDIEPGLQVETADPEPVASAPARVVEPDPGLWPWLSAALAFGWAATIGVWAFSSRRGRESVAGQSVARATSTRALLKQLVAACRVDDAPRARDLLLEWAARQYSEDPPASLGALADRLSGPLADQITALESALYGPGGESWQGKGLAEAVKSAQSVTPKAAAEGEDPLVPLYR